MAEEFGEDELLELAFMLDLDAGLLASPADDVGVVGVLGSGRGTSRMLLIFLMKGGCIFPQI